MEEEGSFCLNVHHNLGSAFFKAVQAAKEEKSYNAKNFARFSILLLTSRHFHAGALHSETTLAFWPRFIQLTATPPLNQLTDVK